jgi:hypothetical protein
VAAGVSAAATTSQATGLVAGTDAPTSPLSASSAASTSANTVGSVTTSAVTSETESSVITGTALQASADKSFMTSVGTSDMSPPASGITSAQATTETGTGTGATIDPSCVDDRPAEVAKLLKLKTPHDHKWTMTGKKCGPRTNTSSAPRFVAYWSQ